MRTAVVLLAAVVAVGCGGPDVAPVFDEERLRATVQVLTPDADPEAVEALVDSIRATCEGDDDSRFVLAWGMSDQGARSFITAGCQGRVQRLGLG